MPYRTSRWRITFGIVISLLLHLAALVWLRLPEPKMGPDPRSWLSQVQVRIVAPAPPPQAEPELEADKASAPARVAAEARRRPKERQRPAQASTPAAKEGMLVLQPAEPGAGNGKRFDREAAKAAARDIAAELDTGPIKTRETRDEKLARQIQEAARPNCKDGIPGGLLAPLILLMDKKDSGCKW